MSVPQLGVQIHLESPKGSPGSCCCPSSPTPTAHCSAFGVLLLRDGPSLLSWGYSTSHYLYDNSIRQPAVATAAASLAGGGEASEGDNELNEAEHLGQGIAFL